MRMDPEKVSKLTDSCQPEGVLAFLSFANFYRKFITNFSAITTPLHALTSSKSQVSCSPQAKATFQKLKQSFTTAPVLTLPDPSLQFVVEVSAFDLGIGAILSQRSV